MLLIITFCLSEASYSAPVNSGLSGITIKKPIEEISKDPARFEAPLDFSTLKEIHKGTNDTFIIHIQDAHSNLSGQENLAKTLDAIMKRYGVSLVLVEGGSVCGNLDPLKKIASQQVTKQVARSLLTEGQIAGEEYLNLTSDNRMKIMGIEDMPLYFNSVKNYTKLADRRQEILEYLETIQGSVDKLKSKLYPKNLLGYEKEKTAGDASSGNGFDGILKLVSQKQIDLNSFPTLKKLQALKEKEKVIDFNLTNLEQLALIKEIEKKGQKQKLKEYLEKFNQAKNSKASQFSLFQNIFQMAEEKSVSISQYQNLILYGEYLKEFQTLDLDKVLGELERVEDKVYISMLLRHDTRLIRSIDRYLGLLKTAYKIQMTTKDFQFFKTNEPDFVTISYLAFINRKLADFGYFEDIIPYMDILEQGKEALEAFYESVNQRDEAFVRNAQRIMREQNQKTAFLISGGYHTQNLKKLFEQTGDSFGVLAPNVASETNQKKYEELLFSTVKKGRRREIRLINGNSAISSGVRYLGVVPGRREDGIIVRLRDQETNLRSIREARSEFFYQRYGSHGRKTGARMATLMHPRISSPVHLNMNSPRDSWSQIARHIKDISGPVTEAWRFEDTTNPHSAKILEAFQFIHNRKPSTQAMLNRLWKALVIETVRPDVNYSPALFIDPTNDEFLFSDLRFVQNTGKIHLLLRRDALDSLSAWELARLIYESGMLYDLAREQYQSLAAADEETTYKYLEGYIHHYEAVARFQLIGAPDAIDPLSRRIDQILYPSWSARVLDRVEKHTMEMPAGLLVPGQMQTISLDGPAPGRLRLRSELIPCLGSLESRLVQEASWVVPPEPWQVHGRSHIVLPQLRFNAISGLFAGMELGLRLKGNVYLDELGRPRSPESRPYQGPGRPGAAKALDPAGRLYYEDNPGQPWGTATSDSVMIEANMSYEFMSRGFYAAIPVGDIEREDSQYIFDGQKTGSVLQATPTLLGRRFFGEATEQITRFVTLIMLEKKARAATQMLEADAYRRAAETEYLSLKNKITSFGQHLRKLHDAGLIHGYSRDNNFTWMEAQRTFFNHDLEDARLKKGMNLNEALLLQFEDLRQAYTSVHAEFDEGVLDAIMAAGFGSRPMNECLLEGYFGSDAGQIPPQQRSARALDSIVLECIKTPIAGIDHPLVNILRKIVQSDPEIRPFSFDAAMLSGAPDLSARRVDFSHAIAELTRMSRSNWYQEIPQITAPAQLRLDQAPQLPVSYAILELEKGAGSAVVPFLSMGRIMVAPKNSAMHRVLLEAEPRIAQWFQNQGRPVPRWLTNLQAGTRLAIKEKIPGFGVQTDKNMEENRPIFGARLAYLYYKIQEKIAKALVGVKIPLMLMDSQIPFKNDYFYEEDAGWLALYNVFTYWIIEILRTIILRNTVPWFKPQDPDYYWDGSRDYHPTAKEYLGATNLGYIFRTPFILSINLTIALTTSFVWLLCLPIYIPALLWIKLISIIWDPDKLWRKFECWGPTFTFHQDMSFGRSLISYPAAILIVKFGYHVPVFGEALLRFAAKKPYFMPDGKGNYHDGRIDHFAIAGLGRYGENAGPKTVRALVKLLKDPYREAVASATLYEIKNKYVPEALYEALRNEPSSWDDKGPIVAVAGLLEEIEGLKAVPAIVERIRVEKNWEAFRGLAQVLRNMNSLAEALTAFIEKMDGQFATDIKCEALHYLREIRGPDADPVVAAAMVKLLSHETHETLIHIAARILEDRNSLADAIGTLQQRLARGRDSLNIVILLVDILTDTKNPENASTFIDTLKRNALDHKIVRKCLNALKDINSLPAAVPVLCEALIAREDVRPDEVVLDGEIGDIIGEFAGAADVEYLINVLVLIKSGGISSAAKALRRLNALSLAAPKLREAVSSQNVSAYYGSNRDKIDLLGEIGGAESVPVIIEALRKRPDEYVIHSALGALRRMNSLAPAVPLLLELLDEDANPGDDVSETRNGARLPVRDKLKVIEAIGDAGYIVEIGLPPALIKLLRDKDAGIASCAQTALEKILISVPESERQKIDELLIYLLSNMQTVPSYYLYRLYTSSPRIFESKNPLVAQTRQFLEQVEKSSGDANRCKQVFAKLDTHLRMVVITTDVVESPLGIATRVTDEFVCLQSAGKSRSIEQFEVLLDELKLGNYSMLNLHAMRDEHLISRFKREEFEKRFAIMRLLQEFRPDVMKILESDPWLKFLRLVSTEVEQLPLAEQKKLIGQIGASLGRYNSILVKSPVSAEEFAEMFGEFCSLLSIVHSNFPLVLDAITATGQSVMHFRPLREALYFNNPLTRIIRMLGERSNIIGGNLEFTLKMQECGQFDYFFEAVVDICNTRKRLAPQEVAGMIDLLKNMKISKWNKADWDTFQASISRYHQAGFKVLNVELYNYFMAHENEATTMEEFKTDVDRELGNVAWGSFKGLSDAFKSKYGISDEGELSLVSRFIPAANLSVKDFVRKYQQIKAVLAKRGIAWTDEVDEKFRHTYAFYGTEGYVKYESDSPQAETARKALCDNLQSYTETPEPTLEAIVDLLGNDEEFSKLTDTQKKRAIIEFVLRARGQDRQALSRIPATDQELLDWLIQWASFLQDTWKADYADQLREMVRKKIATLEGAPLETLFKSTKLDRFQFGRIKKAKELLPTGAQVQRILDLDGDDEKKIAKLKDLITPRMASFASDDLRNPTLMASIMSDVVISGSPIVSEAFKMAHQQMLSDIGDRTDEERKLVILADKISAGLVTIFSKDIETIQSEVPKYIRHERDSEEVYRVGFYDDLSHLMSFMMTGVCTWVERDRQVADTRYHFAKIAVKDTGANVLAVSQVQLAKCHIQGLPQKTTPGWSMLALPGINRRPGDIGMSSEKAVLAILEAAQRYAEETGLEGAIIPDKEVIYTNHPTDEGKIIKNLLAKGWLRRVTLTETIVLSQGPAPQYSYSSGYLIQIPKGSQFLALPSQQTVLSDDDIDEQDAKKEETSVLVNDFIEVEKRAGEEAGIVRLAEETVKTMPRKAIVLAKTLAQENNLRVKIEPGFEKSIVTKTDSETVLHIGRDVMYAPGEFEPVLFKIKMAELLTSIILPDYNELKSAAQTNENAYFKLSLIQGLLLWQSRFETYHYQLNKLNWTKESGNFLQLMENGPRDKVLGKYRDDLKRFTKDLQSVSQWNVFLNVMDNGDPEFLVCNYLEALTHESTLTNGSVFELIKSIRDVPIQDRPSVASVREVFKMFILGRDVHLRISGKTVSLERYDHFSQDDLLGRIQETLVNTGSQNEFYTHLRQVLEMLIPKNAVNKEIGLLVDENLFGQANRLEAVQNALSEIIIRYLGSNTFKAFEQHMTASRGFENIPYLVYSTHDLNKGDDADAYGFLDYSVDDAGVDYDLVFRGADYEAGDSDLADEEAGTQEDWVHELFMTSSRRKKPGGARLANAVVATRGLLATYKISKFPSQIIANASRLGAVKRYLPFLVSAGKVPVALSPSRLAVLEVSRRSAGLRIVKIGNRNFEFSTKDFGQAAARLATVHSIETSLTNRIFNVNLEAQQTFEAYNNKETLTRQLLRRIVKNIIKTQNVVLFLCLKDQDKTEMLKQLQELEAELTEHNKLNEKAKLNLYPRFVDENGKEILVQGFTSKPLPSEPVKVIYTGILHQGLLKAAIDQNGSYLPMEASYTKQGQTWAIPYKADIRTAIATPIDEEVAAQMLQRLVDPDVRIDSKKMKIIREPSSIQDITTNTYRTERLIVRSLAKLTQRLYEAYVALRATGSSA